MKLWVEKGAYLKKRTHKIAKYIQINGPIKILVIRHAALGDMLQTRPFLIELRKCFPKSHITLSLISNYQYGAPIDLVDDVHILEGSDQRNTSFIKRIKNFYSLGKFDLLFDLACTSRSKILTFCTKAIFKLSFPYKKNLCLYHVNIHRSDFRFEAENLLEFLFLFGHQPEFPINYCLPKNMCTVNEVLMFFGASNTNRCYPIDYWIKLIPLLSKKYPDIKWVILEGHQKNENYYHIYEKLKLNSPNIYYQKSLTLEELSKKIQTIKCLIANDTGIRHLAISHATPTIGFFYNTCPGRNCPTYNSKNLILLNQEDGHLMPEVSFEKISNFLNSI